MRGRHAITLPGLAALAVAWVALATGGTGAGIASILPVLLLLLPLLARRYPGEARLARLRDVHQQPIRRPRAGNARTPRTTRRIHAHGGLLLACGLAVRPPPAAPAHA